VDLDTLRLLAVFPSQGTVSLEELADLWRVFTAPELGDVVRFSMELLPVRLRSEEAAGRAVLQLRRIRGHRAPRLVR
jgi:hypothetical protein